MDDCEWLERSIFAVLLQHASSFARRVVEPIAAFPFRLLLLAKSPNAINCTERAQVARQILETPLADLEINTRKVKQMYLRDLKVAATDGVLTGALQLSIRAVARHWECDTRECERINKMLNLFTDRAPTASFELQSSRACLKHFLGEAGNPGVTKKKHKWSQYKPTACNLMQMCLNSWGDRKVQENIHRWSSPELPLGLPIDKEMTKIYDGLIATPKNSVVKVWAACYNMMVNKELEQHSDCPCPVICCSLRQPGNSTSAFSYYISVEKIRTTRRFVPCVVHGKEIWLKEPLEFQNSVDVFASFWQAVKAGAMVSVFIVKPCKPQRKLREMFNLRFIGVSESKPYHVCELKKPTTKMTKGRVGNDIDGEEHNESEKNSDTDNKEDNHDDTDESMDSLYKQALDLLTEDTEDSKQPQAQAINSVGNVIRESATGSGCLDELEENEQDFMNEVQDETMETTVNAVEQQRAINALASGICPLPRDAEVCQLQTSHNLDDENTAFMEAVLNNSGLPDCLSVCQYIFKLFKVTLTIYISYMMFLFLGHATLPTVTRFRGVLHLEIDP